MRVPAVIPETPSEKRRYEEANLRREKRKLESLEKKAQRSTY